MQVLEEPPTEGEKNETHYYKEWFVTSRWLPQDKRREKLLSLLALQDFKHPSEEETKSLFQVIQKHNQLFILHPSEIGKKEAPPVKIAIEDHTPVREPMHWYPEKKQRK